MQLDLLAYQLTPEEQQPVDAIVSLPARPPAVQNAIDWHQSKADYYLRMMNRFMAGNRCRQSVRRQEISRLHELRLQELAAIDRLKGASHADGP